MSFIMMVQGSEQDFMGKGYSLQDILDMARVERKGDLLIIMKKRVY